MAGAICTLFVGAITAVSRSDPISREGLSLKTALVVPLTVASLASFWEYQVTKNVPEPYLVSPPLLQTRFYTLADKI